MHIHWIQFGSSCRIYLRNMLLCHVHYGKLMELFQWANIWIVVSLCDFPDFFLLFFCPLFPFSLFLRYFSPSRRFPSPLRWMYCIFNFTSNRIVISFWYRKQLLVNDAQFCARLPHIFITFMDAIGVITVHILQYVRFSILPHFRCFHPTLSLNSQPRFAV